MCCVLAVKSKQNICTHYSDTLTWRAQETVNRSNSEDLGERSVRSGLRVLITVTYVTLKEQSLRLVNGSPCSVLSCLGGPVLFDAALCCKQVHSLWICRLLWGREPLPTREHSWAVTRRPVCLLAGSRHILPVSLCLQAACIHLLSLRPFGFICLHSLDYLCFKTSSILKVNIWTTCFCLSSFHEHQKSCWKIELQRRPQPHCSWYNVTQCYRKEPILSQFITYKTWSEFLGNIFLQLEYLNVQSSVLLVMWLAHELPW